MKELHPQPISIDGQTAYTFDSLPEVGSIAPPFCLADVHFEDRGLDDFSNKSKILNIVPSLDTPVCQLSVRRFFDRVAKIENAVVITISADLPFAHARFCDAFQMASGKVLSTFRSPEFGMDYGTLIVDHPMMGLQARAVLVLDEHNTVLHTQLVPELMHEPDYDAALQSITA